MERAGWRASGQATRRLRILQDMHAACVRASRFIARHGRHRLACPESPVPCAESTEYWALGGAVVTAQSPLPTYIPPVTALLCQASAKRGPTLASPNVQSRDEGRGSAYLLAHLGEGVAEPERRRRDAWTGQATGNRGPMVVLGWVRSISSHCNGTGAGARSSGTRSPPPGAARAPRARIRTRPRGAPHTPGPGLCSRAVRRA